MARQSSAWRATQVLAPVGRAAAVCLLPAAATYAPGLTIHARVDRRRSPTRSRRVRDHVQALDPPIPIARSMTLAGADARGVVGLPDGGRGADDVRRDDDRAGGDWHLRPGRVYRAAKHAGDRHPHGGRRQPRSMCGGISCGAARCSRASAPRSGWSWPARRAARFDRCSTASARAMRSPSAAARWSSCRSPSSPRWCRRGARRGWIP